MNVSSVGKIVSRKIAFVFPGQGTQYVGMGKIFYDKYPVAQKIFNSANKVLGFDLKKICFEGPEEKLKQTEYTQPAILTVSVAALEILKEKRIKPDWVAGHSLGEYSALVAAGAMFFEEAVKLVHLRGKFMQEAVIFTPGSMAAVIGLNCSAVNAICEGVSEEGLGVVEVSNINAPDQIIISGETGAVEKASRRCQEAGAKKVVFLPVSAPFHCSLIKDVESKLDTELLKIDLRNPSIPVIANVTADCVKTAAKVRELLARQVVAPVRWQETVEKMIREGINTFVEVGPGKVLSGLIKKIAGDIDGITILNVEDEESLNKTLEVLSSPPEPESVDCPDPEQKLKQALEEAAQDLAEAIKNVSSEKIKEKINETAGEWFSRLGEISIEVIRILLKENRALIAEVVRSTLEAIKSWDEKERFINELVEMKLKESLEPLQEAFKTAKENQEPVALKVKELWRSGIPPKFGDENAIEINKYLAKRGL